MSKIENQLLVWAIPHALSYHGYIPGFSRAKKSISTRAHLVHGVVEHAATMSLHKDVGSFEMFRIASSLIPALIAR
jgi:hypothetical protein